jgi:hypothetical protein
MLNENYHNVPPTIFVEFYHPSFEEREDNLKKPIKSEKYFVIENEMKTKHGSLQMYAIHDDMVCNYSCNVFSV